MPRRKQALSETATLDEVRVYLNLIRYAMDVRKDELPRNWVAGVGGYIAEAERLIGFLEKQAAAGIHRNPALLIHNPPARSRRGRIIRLGQDEGELFGSEVEEIRYRHQEDAAWYKHQFEHPTQIHMYAMSSPRRHNWIAIVGQSVDVWKEF